jgi:2,3-bisphosphoglycerate-dependent phosphoglycerate mutase
MGTLILVRHGQSTWNAENRFTGWVDVPLTPQGEAEARATGQRLKAQGVVVDKAFVSPLSRAHRTLELVTAELGQAFPVTEAPEMIERFYGNLTGLNKAETAQQYGEDQVHLWRRSYDVAPPALPNSHEWHPANDTKFKHFPFTLPSTESLKDVVHRVQPYWENVLKPAASGNKTVLVVAHGNSIRALIKIIKNLGDEDVQQLEIGTAEPVSLAV